MAMGCPMWAEKIRVWLPFSCACHLDELALSYVAVATRQKAVDVGICCFLPRFAIVDKGAEVDDELLCAHGDMPYVAM